MPDHKVHGEDCIALLGEPFYHVHIYLDSYAKDFPPPVFYDYHRSLLHNSYGLTLVRQEWGEAAYKAGLIHLSRDYDDTCPVEKLLERSARALVWFNNLEHMELHLMPRYINCREEGLIAMLDWKRED
jgi:hypothetical protein